MKNRIINTVAVISALAAGAWLLGNAAYSEYNADEKNNNSGNVYEQNEKIPNENTIKNIEKNNLTGNENNIADSEGLLQEPEEIDLPQKFELKDEEAYSQLRLIVSVKSADYEKTVEYMKKRINVSEIYSAEEQAAFTLPKEDYDLALNAIIDCPYTENVVYRNEDYYPVAQRIFFEADDENVSSETVSTLENIELFCQKAMVVIQTVRI